MQDVCTFYFDDFGEYEYSILLTGFNEHHIKHSANYIIKTMSKLNYKVRNKSSMNAESGWVVLDYIDIIIHLFTPEKRLFYNLDELYSKNSVKKISSE